jgi:hypothetical protein
VSPGRKRSARRAATPRAVGKQKPRSRRAASPNALTAAPVTAAELRALRRELEQRLGKASGRGRSVRGTGGKPGSRPAPLRWNPNPEDVQKSVAQLVLTIVEFLRQLMERQAIRRMEARTLSDQEIEAVGAALMQLERTIREIGKRFGLTPDELNLDLGAIKLM